MNTTTLLPGEESPYGVLIAPQLNAPFHQHIFAARLIMNVDGPENSVYEVNTASKPAGPDNRYGNAFDVQETLLATGKKAQRRINSNSARYWKVVNPSQKNRMGKPVAYRLIPGENCPPFVRPDANIMRMRRAGFAANHVWVTPYKQEEHFPAGDYANQHPTGDGLHRWTVADRNVTNTRVVVWYVFSHNHIPRMEDWPVMPVAHICFYLKPDGFFERNPALDAPNPPNMHAGGEEDYN